MKGYNQDDKNTIRLPRQHMQKPHGPLLFPGPGPQKRIGGHVFPRFSRHLHRGDWKQRPPGHQGKAAPGRHHLSGTSGKADEAQGLWDI